MSKPPRNHHKFSMLVSIIYYIQYNRSVRSYYNHSFNLCTWEIRDMEYNGVLLPKSLQTFWMSKGFVLSWGDLGKAALCKSGGSRNPSGAKDGIKKLSGTLSLQPSGQSLVLGLSTHAATGERRGNNTLLPSSALQAEGDSDGHSAESAQLRTFYVHRFHRTQTENTNNSTNFLCPVSCDQSQKMKKQTNKQTNKQTTTTKKLLFKQLANPGYENSLGCVSHFVQFPAWLRPSPSI